MPSAGITERPGTAWLRALVAGLLSHTWSPSNPAAALIAWVASVPLTQPSFLPPCVDEGQSVHLSFLKKRKDRCPRTERQRVEQIEDPLILLR